MEKIKSETALLYIKEYEIKMKELGVDTREKGFTKSVGFNKAALQEWLRNLGSDTTEIKINFGLYSSPAQNKLKNSGTKNPEGRFTVILWPCNAEGEPANTDDKEEELPVNAGELVP